MRINRQLLSRGNLYFLTLLFSCACLSCEELMESSKVSANGSLEYTLRLDNTTTDSLLNTNINIVGGDTVRLIVNQKGSYTDPTGMIYTCEPQALIEFFTTADTIFVSDLETLKQLDGVYIDTTTQSGSNPITYTMGQRFKIGMQEIAFNFSHEVYSCQNSLSQTVEMPYLKVSNVTLSSIDFDMHSLTKAIITDTVMFRVNAEFEVELESMNTQKANKETIIFAVSYIGAIEQTYERSGEGTITYILTKDSSEATSPFILKGSDSISLNIEQENSFLTDDSVCLSYKPKASIAFNVKNDTAYVKKEEELKSLIEASDMTKTTEGDNPISTFFKKSFSTKSQTFEFEGMYETYIENTEEMPHIEISEPKYKGIEIKKITKAKTTTHSFAYEYEYDTTFYNVNTKFEVELKGVNVIKKLTDALYFESNYIGAVLNKPFMRKFGVSIDTAPYAETGYVIPSGKAWDALKEQNPCFVGGSVASLMEVWQQYLTPERIARLKPQCTTAYECSDGMLYLLDVIGDDFAEFAIDLLNDAFVMTGYLPETYYRGAIQTYMECDNKWNVPNNEYWEYCNSSPTGNPTLTYVLSQSLLGNYNYKVEITLAPNTELTDEQLAEAKPNKFSISYYCIGADGKKSKKTELAKKIEVDTREVITLTYDSVTALGFGQAELEIRGEIGARETKYDRIIRIAQIKVTPIGPVE